MASARTPSDNEPATHFSPQSKAKANCKSTNLLKIGSSGISDVAIASAYSEKTE